MSAALLTLWATGDGWALSNEIRAYGDAPVLDTTLATPPTDPGDAAFVTLTAALEATAYFSSVDREYEVLPGDRSSVRALAAACLAAIARDLALSLPQAAVAYRGPLTLFRVSSPWAPLRDAAALLAGTGALAGAEAAISVTGEVEDAGDVESARTIRFTLSLLLRGPSGESGPARPVSLHDPARLAAALAAPMLDALKQHLGPDLVAFIKRPVRYRPGAAT